MEDGNGGFPLNKLKICVVGQLFIIVEPVSQAFLSVVFLLVCLFVIHVLWLFFLPKNVRTCK